jgi:hypothetical protein
MLRWNIAMQHGWRSTAILMIPALLMKDKNIPKSARKRQCTALTNNVESYVSIIKDMLPQGGSQALKEILDVCLTQALLKMKK